MHRCCLLVVVLGAAVAALLVCAASAPWAAEAKGEPKLVPVKIEFPKPVPVPSPKPIKLTDHQELPPRDGSPLPELLAPEGTTNVALKKPVTSSDDAPIIGELSQVTDGDKRGIEGSFVELGPGRQWVQIDLKGRHAIYGVGLWHYRTALRYYHDVVVQVADDADFITNVRTLFNNDYDNTSGLGIGKDREYMETHHGRLIACKGVVAGHVRLYSRGNTENDMNHYAEVEVYATPAK